jgi:hypothetical protein
MASENSKEEKKGIDFNTPLKEVDGSPVKQTILDDWFKSLSMKSKEAAYKSLTSEEYNSDEDDEVLTVGTWCCRALRTTFRDDQGQVEALDAGEQMGLIKLERMISSAMDKSELLNLNSTRANRLMKRLVRFRHPWLYAQCHEVIEGESILDYNDD